MPAIDSTTAEPRSESELPTILRLAEFAALVRATPGLHVRWSEGPERDAQRTSVDQESGLRLPGLSVNPLDAESWWTRPLEDWLARQLAQYSHLGDENPNRFAWVLRGEYVGRGPDCEPLLAEVDAVAVLGPDLLGEADDRYRSSFDAGRGPEG